MDVRGDSQGGYFHGEAYYENHGRIFGYFRPRDDQRKPTVCVRVARDDDSDLA